MANDAPSNTIGDDVLDRQLAAFSFTRPKRGLEDEYSAQTTWRQGKKPDYRKADLVFFQGKTRSHLPGSLEQITENLVKKWEMEMTHLFEKDWTAVDREKYRVSTNGGKEKNGVDSAVVGTYNWLLEDADKEVYDASKETFESSHQIFRGAFTDGFPWEVLDVYSGPPRVTFSWRHWGTFSGVYKGRKGNNEVIELFGFTIATLGEDLRIQKLEVFFKNEEFLKALQGNKYGANVADEKNDVTSVCPFQS